MAHNENIEKAVDRDNPLLLYFYPTATSFIKQDTAFFSENFHVKVFSFLPSGKLLVPISFIKQKLFILANLRKASIMVCQFAGYHSFLPVLFSKIFCKPCLIVVGGTDCVSFPSIGYGNLRKPVLGWFTLKSLRHATHITSPSSALVRQEYKYDNKDFPFQGYTFFDVTINTPVTIIHNGIDTDKFKPVSGVVRRSRSFLTICNFIDRRNFLLKGIDLFIEAAKSYPDCEFTIIGKIASEFSFEKPVNVNLIDFIPNDQLPAKITEYTYYCQLSMSEGFGVALAESMATGCVPIVSRVGILDYITGDSGFILEKRDPEMLRSIIEKALQADLNALSGKARERVVSLFNKNLRKEAFKNLLYTLIKTNLTKKN